VHRISLYWNEYSPCEKGIEGEKRGVQRIFLYRNEYSSSKQRIRREKGGGGVQRISLYWNEYSPCEQRIRDEKAGQFTEFTSIAPPTDSMEYFSLLGGEE
jgi:hypothetical protein